MKILNLTAMMTVSCLMANVVHAANECKAQYKNSSNQVKTIYLNAGQSKSVNKNNIQWIQNKKSRQIKVKITKMLPNAIGGFYASGTKWVTLSSNGNIDPPLAPTLPYPSGVNFFKISCKANTNSSSSGGSSSSGSSNTSATIISGNLITIPLTPQIRPLTSSERSIAQSVFVNSLNLNMVRVTNTVGFQSRPWTTNTPPIYTINVGISGYQNLAATQWRRLLIHELSHVWQGQHGVPFMSNSAVHQTLSAIQNGGSTGSAYSFTPGKQWSKYNSEQQASIIAKWYKNGRKASDKLYPYIQYNVRPGKPNAKTIFKK